MDVQGFGASLALGNDGERVVSYLETVTGADPHHDLKLAVCHSACGQAGNWTNT